MDELITGRRQMQLSFDETLTIKPADVTSFLKLRDKMLTMLKSHEQTKREVSKRVTLSLRTFSFNFYAMNNYVSEIGKYFKTKK